MSFYTIQTPGNRNEEVKKYLQLREYLRAKDSIDKTGTYTRKRETEKFFKPISKPLKQLDKDLKQDFETLGTEVKALPQAIGTASGEEFRKVMEDFRKSLPAIEQLRQEEGDTMPADESGLSYAGAPPEIEGEEKIKEITTGNKTLDNFLMQKSETTNKDFFSYNRFNGSYYVGKYPITIDYNKRLINYKDKNYDYSNELIDLITNEEDVKNSVEANRQAVEDYKKILLDSGLMYHVRASDDVLTQNSKFSNLSKWKTLNLDRLYEENKVNEVIRRVENNEKIKLGKELLKQFIKEKGEGEAIRLGLTPKPSTSGKGIKQTSKNKNTVFLSSDPNALADRLTLLCASLKAGNTSLNNEIVDICNELIRMKVMTRQQKNKILKHFKPY